jgi:phosphoserine phosphatase RsbU/P
MPLVIPARLARTGLVLLPGLVIAAVVVADLAVGRSIVLGLVVVAPLLAGNVTGPVITAGYGVVALVAGILLGIADDAYVEGDALHAQLIRLTMIALMGVTGALLSRYRLAHERRLTQVIKVAEAAQRAILLPVPEELGAVRVAVHYESAASDALVGGDLYGFVLTQHGLRVLVGDVRGKGLDAVRMSAQVLAAFRERANDDRELPALLDHMDRTVARAAESDEDFVTAVLVQLTDDGKLTVANAGHPPPILLSGTSPRWLEPDPARPPLGLGGVGRALSVSMAPADRLLLYTDGLTEARDPRTRRFYSPQQIIQTISAVTTVADALAGVRDAVLDWSGGVLHDDIALVLIEYHPESTDPANALTLPLTPLAPASRPRSDPSPA